MSILEWILSILLFIHLCIDVSMVWIIPKILWNKIDKDKVHAEFKQYFHHMKLPDGTFASIPEDVMKKLEEEFKVKYDIVS